MMKGNKNIHPSIEKTKDGSNTLYSGRFNQHYHNPGGAVSESEHVFFVVNGLNDALKTGEPITIFETGFGTGLNLLLLTDKYLDSNTSSKINYHTVEVNPISPQTFEKLNYGRHLNHPKITENIKTVFGSLKNGYNHFNLLSGISLTVFNGTFANYDAGDIIYDFIFHDAFSPKANPELWTDTVFKKILKQSDPNAKLTTYCAASKARGAIAAAGWHVARAPGALGKREMTIASPTPDALQSFKQVNEERLAKRYRESDF